MNKVTLNQLLIVYLTIPLCFIIVLLDKLFFNSLIQNTTSADPHNILWFGILFGLPHIIAGNTLFLDKDYIKHYKWKILAIIPFCGVIPLSAYTLGGLICVVFFDYVASAYHWASQQVGILALYSEKKVNKIIKNLWKLTLFVCATATFFKGVGSEFLIQYSITNFDNVIYTTLVASTILTTIIFSSLSGFKCRLYIISSQAAVTGMLGLTEMNYPFFGIACLRLPHDINAFMFYLNHNHTRNKDEIKNFFLKALLLPKRFFAPALIIFSVSFAYFLNWTESLIFASVFSYFHYITESFIWKSLGPHRSNLNITT